MGLFSRKKKPTAEQIAKKAEEARAIEVAQKQREAQARAAAEKAQRDAKRQKEENMMAKIQSKRDDIRHREEAVRTFEVQKKRAQLLAVQAKKQDRMEEAKSHLRDSKTMEKKIANYTVSINMLREQLNTMEDAAVQKDNVETLQDFNTIMADNKVDMDKVDDDLSDMREQMAAVEQINQTFQADMNTNQSIYDMDAEDELNALEADMNKTAINAAPQVPTAQPNTPASSAPVASSAAMSPEEAEILKLEQGLAM